MWLGVRVADHYALILACVFLYCWTFELHIGCTFDNYLDLGVACLGAGRFLTDESCGAASQPLPIGPAPPPLTIHSPGTSSFNVWGVDLHDIYLAQGAPPPGATSECAWWPARVRRGRPHLPPLSQVAPDPSAPSLITVVGQSRLCGVRTRCRSVGRKEVVYRYSGP